MELTDLKANHPEHFRRAAALRVLAMDAVQAANSGHPGMPMGMSDVATVLFEKHLKFDPKNPIEVKKANHYSNLQPLWAIENLKKNKY